ncbi:MAG TPA: hypothetical protein VN600_05975 [Gemmatimonadaceae bacterium]|nr:hypothetical protein [Gemmatimonadaceae bacterium]
MRTALRRTALMLVCVVAAPLSAQSITPGAPAIAPVWMPTSSSMGADSTARPSPETSSNASAASAAAPATSPSDATRAGVHRPDLARPDQPTSLASTANLGQARAMMIVGVAALFAGAIIGDTPGTIIMVGGAVIGLVGLYDYLQ